VLPLVDAGRSAVAFDAPGHGESTLDRPQSNLLELEDSILAAGREFGRLEGAIAHSLGAAGLALALRDGLSVARTVMIAPMTTPLEYFQAFLAQLGVPKARRPFMAASMERRVGYAWSDIAVQDLVADRREPLLVVHDQADREVPFSSGAALAERWPGAQLLATAGLGHRRILRDPAVVERALSFILGAPLQKRADRRCTSCGRPLAIEPWVEPGRVCLSCRTEQELFDRALR
jgi:pimeloyl-ACP methyl ester carboxylesterase